MSDAEGGPRGRGCSMTQPAWMTCSTPDAPSTATTSTEKDMHNIAPHDDANSKSSSAPPTTSTSTLKTSANDTSTDATSDSTTNTAPDSSTESQSPQLSNAMTGSVHPQPTSVHAPQPSSHYSATNFSQTYQHHYPSLKQYGQYTNNSWQPPTGASTAAASSSSSHLDSLLDAIDSKKRCAGAVPTSTSATETTTASAESPYDWSKQFDPTTGLFYYYNFRTGVTQWEVPEGFVDYHVPPPSAASVSSATATSTAVPDHLVASSSFNAKTGAFSGAGGDNYWSRVGRQSDREGRQMAAFFDLDSFAQNREEAKRKKQELQNMSKRGQIDWRKRKEEANQQRKRQKQSWLYDDDAT